MAGSASVRAWPWIGVAAQLLFTGYWLVAPAWQGPNYSALAHSISDMYAVTAPGGAVMAAVLTLCGAATIGWLVFGLRPRLAGSGWLGVAAVVASVCSIFGIGDLLSPFERLACRIADPGCSPPDQTSNLGGQLDATLSTVGIVILIVSGVFVFLASRRSALRAAAWPVLAGTVLLLIAVVGLATVSPGLGGLMERVVAVIGAALIAAPAVVAIRSRHPGLVRS